MSNYYITLWLTRLIDAREMTITDDYGREVKGVFVPIKENGIQKHYASGHVYLSLCASEMAHVNRGRSHYIKPMLTDKTREYLDKMGYRAPYVGTMKPAHYRVF